MHIFNKTILRAYDIRGVFNKTLFCKDAQFIAKSFAKYLNDNNYSGNIAVGYDGRTSSISLKDSLVNGLVESGINVKLINLCPTPVLYYAINHLKCDAGIMITGSHNPKDHNGFKIALHDRPFYGDDIIRLSKIAASSEFIDKIGSYSYYNIIDSYINRIIRDLDFNNDRKLKIAWDCGNGATGEVIKKMISKLKHDSILLYSDIDGNFPNHHPDPSDVNNMKDLQQAVLDSKCDLGIAFDGDGDRIGVVDDKGKIIWGDDLMILYSKDLLRKNPGCKIIADVKASNLLFNKIAEFGGKPIMYKTGHSFIKSKMKQEKALLAGEMSGHIFFADKYYGYDDAIYCAIRLINIIINSSKSLSEIRSEIPIKFSTNEIRINCDDNQKFLIIEKIKNYLNNNNITYNDIDGIRYDDGDGWWLLRASNTQAALVLRCEANNSINLSKIKNSLLSIMDKFSVKIDKSLLL